jgi:hypothetical protein
MPEIGSSGLMSGDGKRGVGHRPQATAPILDSTKRDMAPRHYSACQGRNSLYWILAAPIAANALRAANKPNRGLGATAK